MKQLFRINRMTLGGKLILFQAVTIMVVLLILALIAGQLIKSRFTKNSAQELTDLNKRIIEMIDVYNLKLKEHTVSLANVLVQYGNSGKRGAKGGNISLDDIDRFTGITGAVATLFIREGDDFVRVSTSLRKQDGSRAIGTQLDHNHPGYKRVLAGSTYTGPAVLFGRNYMTHYEPIKNRSEVTGIYFIGLEFTEGIKNLKSKIRSIKIAETGYVYIIEGPKSSESGKCIVHASEKMEGKDLGGLKDNNGREFIKTMLSDMNGVIRYDWTDETGKNTSLKYAVFNHYDEWNWIIVSSATEQELISEGIDLRDYLFIGFFLCSIIILAVLYFAVRIIITARFSKLNGMVKDLSEGKGDLTVRLGFKGEDEIGVLSASFNKFLDYLENMVREIMQAGQNLAQAVDNISEGNQNLSQRTIEQSASLEEITSTLQEAVASLSMNVENAQKARQITGEGASRADSGNKIAEEAVDAINEINSSSKKIMGMLTIINEITFQTNLLSLNAAIEAARAGDKGKGFAVVAGEVRNLAQRSGKTAKEIGEIIKDSISKIERGTSMVTKTGTVLMEIARSSKQIAALIAEMSVASVEQRQSMTQINEAVTTLDSMTQQNSTLVGETASAAGEMASRARDLREMINRFKIRDGGKTEEPVQGKAGGRII